MECLKFRLSGKTACFRRAEFNAHVYFTYNNIHKVALLGLLGAVVGYGGYNRQSGNQYPEFYEKLKNLKISIVPVCENFGSFPKKIQIFNNSVGYASREEGGNLVVREQWLENPCWYIYVLSDGSEEYDKLKEYILEGKAVYPPYLGKNDHPAVIDEAELVNVEKTESRYVNSIVVSDTAECNDDSETEGEDEMPYLVKENAPVAMDSVYNFAIYGKTCFTNYEYEGLDEVFTDGERNLFFY